MNQFRLSAMLSTLLLPSMAVAALAPVTASKGGSVVASSARPPRLSDQLVSIRSEVIALQKDLLSGLKSREQARSQIEKIRTLMDLQRRERALGDRRMNELEKTVRELESRRAMLLERAEGRRKSVRDRMKLLMREPEFLRSSLELNEKAERDAVSRRILSGLALEGVRELEELRVDLADAEMLEQRIQEERQQLAYLFQDLEEQKSVLELNRQIQVDLLRRQHEARVRQLEDYRRLKSSESRVEQMIRDFNARRELEKMVERDRAEARARKAIENGAFARLKGSLALPISGRIVSRFGRYLDPQSKLQVFRKGIDIEAAPGAPIQAVASGKIAYSGRLPGYGRVLIVDHGDHYYSLCGNLGDSQRKTGEVVAQGDELGRASQEGLPVYFEIRSRNIAVNPLQWVSSSISLDP